MDERDQSNEWTAADGAAPDLAGFVTARGQLQRLAVGACLGDEAMRVESLLVLNQGWACRYATTREGGRQILAILLPGDICNLDGFLLGRADYGLRALTAVGVSSLSRGRMLELAERQPEMLAGLLRQLAVDNAALGRLALCLGRKSAEARLAHFLCELAVRLTGSATGAALSFELPLTQELIADAIGITSVHVNRTLQHLRGDGLIELRGRKVTIPSLAALASVGGFDPAYLHREDARNEAGTGISLHAAPAPTEARLPL